MNYHPDLGSLIGKNVRIDRGGPESRAGRLLAIKPDYLALDCGREGVIYYKLDHVKSITFDSQDYSDIHTVSAFTEPGYLEAEQLSDVLNNMRSYWVQINRGGPERLEGILSDWNDEFCQLIVNNQIVHVSNFHMRNISLLPQKQEEDKGQGAEQPQGADQAQVENPAQGTEQMHGENQAQESENAKKGANQDNGANQSKENKEKKKYEKGEKKANGKSSAKKLKKVIKWVAKQNSKKTGKKAVKR